MEKGKEIELITSLTKKEAKKHQSVSLKQYNVITSLGFGILYNGNNQVYFADGEIKTKEAKLLVQDHTDFGGISRLRLFHSCLHCLFQSDFLYSLNQGVHSTVRAKNTVFNAYVSNLFNSFEKCS